MGTSTRPAPCGPTAKGYGATSRKSHSTICVHPHNTVSRRRREDDCPQVCSELFINQFFVLEQSLRAAVLSARLESQECQSQPLSIPFARGPASTRARDASLQFFIYQSM